MAYEILPMLARATDDNGDPISGAKWYFYATGSLTPQSVYADAELTTPLSHPVVADADGLFPPIYLDAELIYRGIMTDDIGVDTLFDIDPINHGGTGGGTFDGGDAIMPYPKQNGAVADGVTNDRDAIVTTLIDSNDLDTGILFTPGVYLVSGNLTIAVDAEFMPGARIKVANGTTITFTGAINAGPSQIFEYVGTGTVNLDDALIDFARAEWWGIAADGSNSYAPITYALESGAAIIQLLRRDYYVEATLNIPAFTELRGMGKNYEGPNTATRILDTQANHTTVILGSVLGLGSNPNDAPRGAALRNLYVGRTVAHTGSNDSACGVFVGFSREVEVEDVRVGSAQTYGFRFSRTVFAKIKNCNSKRDSAAASGTDLWYGYYIDGTADLGAAGNNASLYFEGCQSEWNLGTGVRSIHWYLNVRATDIYIYEPEWVAGEYGFVFEGDSNTTTSDNISNDIKIRNPISDQTTERAYSIHNLRRSGHITITDGYAGFADGRGLYLEDCEGRIDVKSMEIYNGGSEPSVSLDTVKRARISAFCWEPVIGCVMVGSRGCEVDIDQTNIEVVSSAIIHLIGSNTRNVLKASANGGNGFIQTAFRSANEGTGVNNYNEFHITRFSDETVVTTEKVFDGTCELNSVIYGAA